VIETQVPDEKDLLPVSLQSERAYLGLHSIDVFVRNQERSLRFYLDQLGFELAFDVRLQSRERWVAVSPPDGSTVLRLIQPEPNSAEHKLIGRATRIAFVTENVAATFREWSARGVRFRHTPRLRRIKYEKQSLSGSRSDPLIHHGDQAPIWGQVFTRFEDIDRNSFALVSFDEVSKAIEVQRRARAQKLEAERRVAHELEVARQVQARLFPQTLPECSTLEYAGICAQARQVGGDYYDFLVLSPERVGLVIGDVAGKGIAAALLMANLQAHLRSQCLMAVDQPGKLLTSVNQLFYENTPSSSYATLFFAEYDNKTQRLRYVNCGHLSGLLLRSTVLGLFADWACSVSECRICAGDVLALYTDGATESFNDADEEFGESGVLSSLKRNRHQSSLGIAKAVLADVQGFAAGEQQDDITLMVAKCRIA
jgi:phosphoserine phosphatase RsbU/P